MPHDVLACATERKHSPVVFSFVIPGLLIVTLLTLVTAAAAVQPKDIVGRLQHTQLHVLYSRTTFGTAWCVNPECDIIVTNYHVSKVVGPQATLKGVHVRNIASATSEHDTDAREMPTVAGPIKLAYGRDISLLMMDSALARKGMHPVPFYIGQLRCGQKVTVIGFPGGKLASIAGEFVEESSDGLLRFKMRGDVAEGISGGLVLDEQHRAVGMASIEGFDGDLYAIPVWTIADFIAKTNPELYTALFPGELYRGVVSGEEAEDEEPSVDVMQPSSPEGPREGFSPAPALPSSYLLMEEPLSDTPIERYNVSHSVLAMRQRAQLMSQQMKNFVARQTLLLSNGRAWQHEVQVIDGQQRFRTSDGKKVLDELPVQGTPTPGAEWAQLVKVTGSNLRFAVQFEKDITVENRTVKVYRYQVDSADQICQLRVARTFRKVWKNSIPCTGAIWTDEQFNILRISQDMLPPEETGIASFRIVVLYGWWEERLVPVEMYLRQVSTHGRIVVSRAKFDDYRVFTTSSKILVTDQRIDVRIPVHASEAKR